MARNYFIVGIGASAGGLQPIQQFISNVETHHAAFVIISHLPNHPVTKLPVILEKFTDMKVNMIEKNVVAQPGNIYVLPGNLKVKIRDGVLLVRPRRSEEVINTAINDFLFSLAADQRDRAIAVILSGNGSDGADGAASVHAQGGMVLVQDPDSALYSSMPTSAIQADDPIDVREPRKLGQLLSYLVNERHVPAYRPKIHRAN